MNKYNITAKVSFDLADNGKVGKDTIKFLIEQDLLDLGYDIENFEIDEEVKEVKKITGKGDNVG